MLNTITWLVVTCMSLGASGAEGPNEVQQLPNGTTVAVAQAARSSDADMPDPNPAGTKLGQAAEKDGFHWTEAIPWIIAGIAAVFGPVLGCIVAVYRYRHRIREEEEKETAKKRAAKKFEAKQDHQLSETLEDRYRKALREEVGWIKMLGSPDIPNLPLHLLDTFVSLRISETWRSEERFDPTVQRLQQEKERDYTPEQIMQRTFADRRMLLIIGDPGSGKTTLLKYYAMCCMSPERYKRLGFGKPPLPIYFPLRQIRGCDGRIASLPSNLFKWAQDHSLPNDEKWFDAQLTQRPTLVLLDGLDEISDLELRRSVCEWVDNAAEGLNEAKFVVTSRWTGYRKVDQIELGFPHLRADVRDFLPEQQEEFLQKWFCAAFLEERRDDSIARQEWEERQKELGRKRAQVVIEFLREPKNKGVHELAAVPMLLQIVAVIWKQREVLPKARAELYQAALKYLLDYRDRRRSLDPLLPADLAMRVLRPVSLWMQEDLQKDEVDRGTLHQQMQAKIDKINDKLTAKEFCENLRDRAGLIADYGESAYIFRHKSFREYLAALELVDVTKRDQKRLGELIKYFGDDWWEEPLRFYISEADDKLFDGFMDALFTSEVSKELDQKQQNLLQTMICEASEVKVDSLCRRLNDGRVHETKKRYILDCLKTMDTQDSRSVISDFCAKAPNSAAGRYARGIAAEMMLERVPPEQPPVLTEVFKDLPTSFQNAYEFNAEYIRIPAGTFEYSFTKQNETIRTIYFAKYPVTNKRYRRFISYLAGDEAKLGEILPGTLFSERMLEFSTTIEGFKEYLGTDRKRWAEKLRSTYDQEKRFKADDQPVVGVSWFGARSYCLWLSLLEAAAQGAAIEELGRAYRLPSETEWEWAAGGGRRRYPWGDKEPSDKLANYDQNVGATTPVGRYPEGATPDGLMDMAGNVWEWMENWHEDYVGKARSLRGGSWYVVDAYLRCSARLDGYPGVRNDFIGFRVVCSQS